MIYLLIALVNCYREKTIFCALDNECRPGYYCESDALCTWPKHCLGASCVTYDDCDRDLICISGKCSNLQSSKSTSTTTSTTTPSPTEFPENYDPYCMWPGHCLGDSCITYDDCDGTLICTGGKCVEIDCQVSSSVVFPAPSPNPSTIPPPSGFPISSGNKAVLTYFTDNTFECIGATVPPEFSMAVNPLLLGYTPEFYRDLNGNTPPWCGKTITLTVNGRVFIGQVIDTCNPLDTDTFPDPITGEPIGGKCDFDNVIDLYGDVGRNFLMEAVGDDFFDGDVNWVISN